MSIVEVLSSNRDVDCEPYNEGFSPFEGPWNALNILACVVSRYVFLFFFESDKSSISEIRFSLLILPPFVMHAVVKLKKTPRVLVFHLWTSVNQ